MRVATVCSSVLLLPRYLLAGHHIVCAQSLCRATYRDYHESHKIVFFIGKLIVKNRLENSIFISLVRIDEISLKYLKTLQIKITKVLQFFIRIW